MLDPADVVGDDATKRAAFKDAFLLPALPIEKLERLVLEARVRAIGRQA